MTLVGLYVPGGSLLHRCPAGAKLAGLAVLVVVVLQLRTPAQVGLAALVVLLGFRVAPRCARCCGWGWRSAPGSWC